jgi:putative ABC transport system permease protein
VPLSARLASLRRALFSRRSAERDLDDEISSYVAMLADENRQAGMPPDEARRQAVLTAGGIEPLKEATRDARAGIFWETLGRDVRQGVRSLRRTPVFTAIAITALALGIGASTAIFSVVKAVLLAPLPYRDPGRLVMVMHRRDQPVAPANFLDWRRESSAYESMGAADFWVPNLTDGEVPESVSAVRLTSEVLEQLGVRPSLGRLLRRDEETPGRDHTVVLADSLWRRRFGADPGVLGRIIHLNGEAYTVVGVMPRGFEFPPFWATGTELWAPLALGDRAGSRDAQSLRLFARLKPGVTLHAAREEMTAITVRLERLYPGSNRDVTVTPLEELVVGNVRPALLVLMAAVAFVLLIACANIAHMLLARATARSKEIAVRGALGASRSRIVREVLTESLVLGLAGGAVGLLLAAGSIHALRVWSRTDLPRLDAIALDPAVVAFAVTLSVLTGVAFGLAPALEASRPDPARILSEAPRGSTEGPGRSRLRNVLVGSEFTLALVLLAGAGLMIRSFLALERIDPGFDRRGVLTMTVSVAGSAAQSPPARRAAFYQEMVRSVERLPGVESASAINHLPLAGDLWGWSFTIEGRPKPLPGENPDAAYRVVLPGYFRTMGIPLLRGRDIAASDRRDAPGVVVINQWMAERDWPGQNPLGQRITVDNGKPDPYWLTVVGVAKNTVRDEWVTKPWAEIYIPVLQTPTYLERTSTNYSYLTLVVRGRGDPGCLAPSVESAIRSLDRTVTISAVQTMDHAVSQATARPRFYLMLLATFAAIALTLAAVGIFGVMSYTVSRRTHEIGIRIALGAQRTDVHRLLIGQAMLTALTGAGAGLAAALLLTRLMRNLLYGVGATDPATFAGVSLLLLAVALLATWIPARRAVRIDPLEAIRHD